MEKTRVVTFRIEENVLNEVDQIANRHGYYKRSHVIAAGLRIMVELEKRNLAGQALSYHPNFDDIDTLAFKMHRKVR